MKKAAIISLGCARNQVDSEVILGSLKESGYRIARLRDGVDLCVINTCSFVEAARKESVEAILEVVDLKRRGKVKRVVIAGCLAQLYKGKIAAELPEVDLVFGTSDIPRAASYIGKIARRGRRTRVGRETRYLYDDLAPRAMMGPRHSAYIKISEGCSNSCSYCIISRLRGPFRSRSVDSVLAEAARLASDSALKEINLIGQDTTLFGIDRYGKMALGHLLKRLCRLKDKVRWIRLLYTHPAHYSDELIAVIRGEEKICKYLDIPIQHASDRILGLMNRRISKKEISALIEKLRKDIPGVALRTSVIVGFPGETEEEFRELTGFIRSTKFERLGAFTYSREDGTKASRLPGQLSEEVKARRLDELMRTQQAVSLKRNRLLVGRSVDVLIDEKVRGGGIEYLGRTEHDAPEVDCGVYVSGKGVKPGEFCRVRITGATEYDLTGVAA